MLETAGVAAALFWEGWFLGGGGDGAETGMMKRSSRRTSIPGRGNCKSKGPEAGTGLAGAGKVTVAGGSWKKMLGGFRVFLQFSPVKGQLSFLFQSIKCNKHEFLGT